MTISAEYIGAMLDALRAAAQALASADAAVHEASIARAEAEKDFITKRTKLNLLLTNVVDLAERGAEWRTEGGNDGRISSPDRPIPWVRGSDTAAPAPPS